MIRKVAGKEKHHYFALLVSLILLPVVSAFLEKGSWEKFFLAALLVMVMIVCSCAVSHKKHTRIITMILAIIAGLMWSLGHIFNLHPFSGVAFQVCSCLTSFVFLLVVASLILKDIFSGKVNVERLYAAICVYLMLGIMFSILNILVISVDPYAYRMDMLTEAPVKNFANFDSSERFSIFLYYSFVTLSTLGYGDITPVSRAARTLGWLEAIAGQLYLTVTVARLVGLHIATSSTKTDDSQE